MLVVRVFPVKAAGQGYMRRPKAGASNTQLEWTETCFNWPGISLETPLFKKADISEQVEKVLDLCPY